MRDKKTALVVLDTVLEAFALEHGEPQAALWLLSALDKYFPVGEVIGKAGCIEIVTTSAGRRVK